VEENAALKEAFEVLTLSADRGERLYVSTMEARRYPITATQWCALL
jgi:gamma-glutamyl hydrolase